MSEKTHVKCTNDPREKKECNGLTVHKKTLYPWKEECPPPKARELCKTKLTSLQIERMTEDAVVRIHTQTLLTAAVNEVPVVLPPFTGLEGQTPQNTFDTYVTYGNGFRIKGGLIVCPAHLVLLPPNLLQYFSLYSQQTIPGIIPNGNSVQRVERILVDVFNVNGSGKSFTYEAQIYGVDGVNDVAILIISPDGNSLCSDFNTGDPQIKNCHPYLTFGCSREYRNTEPAYVVGDTVTSFPGTSSLNQSGYQGFSSRGILSTTVKSYRHTDYVGLVQPELILLDGPVYSSSGAPIINKYGQVIGMQTLSVPGVVKLFSSSPLENITTVVGDGAVGGISSFSMMRSIVLIESAHKGFVVPQAQLMTDNLNCNSFYLLGHAYLGVAWDLVTGSAFGSYIDSISGRLIPRLNSSHLDLTSGPLKKHIVGIRVRALAGQQVPSSEGLNSLVKYIGVPGVTQVPGSYESFVDSPLLTPIVSPGFTGYVIQPNDIITDINCMRIGDLENQAPLSLALNSLSPGDEVVLTVRIHTNDESSYNNIVLVKATLVTMPNWVNFPWYKYPYLTVRGLFGEVPIGLNTLFPQISVGQGEDNFAPFFPSI